MRPNLEVGRRGVFPVSAALLLDRWRFSSTRPHIPNDYLDADDDGTMSVTKGVILVGGPSKGTRMRPLSLDCEWG